MLILVTVLVYLAEVSEKTGKNVIMQNIIELLLCVMLYLKMSDSKPTC